MCREVAGQRCSGRLQLVRGEEPLDQGEPAAVDLVEVVVVDAQTAILPQLGNVVDTPSLVAGDGSVAVEGCVELIHGGG